MIFLITFFCQKSEGVEASSLPAHPPRPKRFCSSQGVVTPPAQSTILSRAQETIRYWNQRLKNSRPVICITSLLHLHVEEDYFCYPQIIKLILIMAVFFVTQLHLMTPTHYLWPKIPTENIAEMFYPLPCALFCDKNGNLAHNRRLLLQTKCKTVLIKDWSNISWSHRNLRSHAKTPTSESELKQQEEIWNMT